jgi:phosphoribosylamine--glycine ligase
VRVLGITETCDLGSLYQRLLAEGHEVQVTVSEPLAAGTMAGIVPRAGNPAAGLEWIEEAGGDGIVLFEANGFGAWQDKLRSRGFRVIGGSAFGDRLEEDRAYGQRLLAGLGLPVAEVTEHAGVSSALADLAARPRRCVFKRAASAGETFVGAFDDGSDVAAMLAASAAGRDSPFILMDHVEGIEVGIGAYFDGQRFLRPACLDWEHKRFFAGDMGELTGEMGTVATFERSDRLFEATLAQIEGQLCAAGHVGYVNLNTIVNESGVWPLEFTCRFGYPGFAVLEPLQRQPWGELLAALAAGQSAQLAAAPGFSVGLVLSTPPFPWSRPELDSPIGLPVSAEGIEPEHLHWGEVGLAANGPAAGRLVTSGLYGWTAVVTGTGTDVREAQAAAYARARRVRAPNLRYRLDIGDRLAMGELERLSALGWLA